MAKSSWRSAITLGFLAVTVPRFLQYGSGRYFALKNIIDSIPHKLPSIATFDNHRVLFADRVRNCEDVIMVPELRAAILSCDEGRDGWNTVMGSFARDLDSIPAGALWLYDYASSDAAPRRLEFVDFPGSKLFHPLGVAVDFESKTLFAVNHDMRGPRMEVFKLEHGAEKLALRHINTIEHPLLHAPNSIEIIGPTELYITNDHFFISRRHPWLSFLENYLAFPQGNIVRLKLTDAAATTKTQDPVKSIHKVADLPFANGIARINATTLAVASTNTPGIFFYDILPGGDLRPTHSFKLSYYPDNLSIDDNGALLIAGHPFPPGLTKVSRSRIKCEEDRANNTSVEPPHHCRKALAPSWASEWTEVGGVRDIFVTGSGFGSSSTAVRDSRIGVGIISGLYDEGILVWRE